MMNVTPLRISRRSIAIATALAGMVSLAIGAHAALNKRALDAAKAVATEQGADQATSASRIALVAEIAMDCAVCAPSNRSNREAATVAAKTAPRQP